MGLRPTRRNESHHATPAKAGVYVWEELDSCFGGNDVSFDGVSMGLRPTCRNESDHVTPAKAGVYVWEELDSRFRGNDVVGVIFRRAKRSTSEVRRIERLI
jgi:hypothetical protein